MNNNKNQSNKQDQQHHQHQEQQQQKVRQEHGPRKHGQNTDMLQDGAKPHEQERPETRMTR